MRRTPDHAARLGHATTERPDDLRRVHLRPAAQILPAGGARSNPGFSAAIQRTPRGPMRIGRGKSPRAIASYSAERDNAVIASTSGRLSRDHWARQPSWQHPLVPSAIGAPPAGRTVARAGPLIRDHRDSRRPRRCDRIRRRRACARLCEPLNHSAGERTDRITHEIEARGVAAKKKKKACHAPYGSEHDPSCASAKRSKKVRILSARVRDLFSRTPSEPS